MFNNGLVALVESGKYDEILNKYFNSTEEASATTSTVDETTIVGLLKTTTVSCSQVLVSQLDLPFYHLLLQLSSVLSSVCLQSAQLKHSVLLHLFCRCCSWYSAHDCRAFIFWGIPNLIESITGQQSPINDFVAGTIALSLNSGAYIAEIVRGGIQAVPAGQMEASRSLGISYGTTMRKIILPQAGKIMLPNFINQFVITLKDTTIISAIGLVELFQAGKIIIARNYQSFRMYAILAIIYLVVITLLTRLARKLEKGGK